jgi:hypothetical protein
MRTIPERNLAYASLISIGQSSGSGFLINIKQSTYLVTARHVLFDEDHNFKIRENYFEIVSPSSIESDHSTSRLGVDFENALYAFSRTADVAIVEIGKNRYKAEGNLWTVTYHKAITRIENAVNNPIIIIEETISPLADVLVANDIYVYGYPTSLGLQPNKFFDASRPLLRKGIVSNIYRRMNTIILDCAVYPGNSGGPVMQISVQDSIQHFKIIGVVSKYIPFAQEWRNSREKLINVEYVNSGYSVATAMDEVISLAVELQSQ